MNKSMADRKKKSKKLWIALGIISAIVLIVLTTVFCIFLRKPNYSYAQINDAFSNYGINVIPWSEKENFKELLAS